MADLLSNPYTLLLLGDIVALFLYYAMHLSFYVMRESFKKHRIIPGIPHSIIHLL